MRRDLEFEPVLPNSRAPVLTPHLAEEPGGPGLVPTSNYLSPSPPHIPVQSHIPATLGFGAGVLRLQEWRVRRKVATWMQSPGIPCEGKV